MMPFYNYIGSSSEPHHKTHQVPYTPYHQYTTSEPVPSQTISNPPNSQVPYNNFSYPTPYPPHHHPYFPIYQPPYPQIPPPMPFYCCGAHPAYPPTYCYPTEQGWYEPDKNAAVIRHYCGCPNHHACSKREEDRVNREGVKIEEQEPDDIVERKQWKQRDSNSGPIWLKNYPFPIMWVPDSNMNEKEQRNLASDKQEKDPSKSLYSNPRNWNGWFPPNLNKLGGSVNEDEKRPFSFPIIWMPSNDKEEEAGKKEMKSDASPKSIDELPSKADGRKISQENKESGGTVKQMEQHKEKGKLEDCEKRTSIPARRIEEKAEKEVSPNNDKKKTATKLPPVCLRVDPFLKKRNGKGSSRSPSPPASSKGPASSSLTEQSQQGVKQLEQQNKNEKIIRVVEVQSCENKDDVQKNELPDVLLVNSELNSLKELSMEESREEKQIEEKDETATEPNGVERKKTGKRYLSETEAAVLVQSAYRGSELRKWQPLRKLKQLAEVKEQALEIRNRIEALDSSPDLQKDEKLQIMIGEMIMRLLLKLDTMQGLHPSVREMRKSLARELVTLQERLDSIMKSEDREHEVSADNAAEYLVDRGTVKVEAEEGGGSGNDCDVIESKESQLSSDMVEYVSGLEAKEGLDRKEGEKLMEKEAVITYDISKGGESKAESEGEKGKEEVQSVQETVAELEDFDQGLSVQVQKEEHAESPEPELKAKDIVNLDSTAGTLDVVPLERKEEEIETVVDKIQLSSETKEDHAVSELENKLEQDEEKNRVVGDSLGIDGASTTTEEENLPSENVLELEHKDLQQISSAIEMDATHESERENIPVQGKENVPIEEKETENATFELSCEPEKDAGSLGGEKGGDNATMELCCENEETETGKLIEENEKMREMIEKLIDAGKKQLNVISNLTARVKHLEEKKNNNKLARKKKPTGRPRRSQPSTFGSSCVKETTAGMEV